MHVNIQTKVLARQVRDGEVSKLFQIAVIGVETRLYTTRAWAGQEAETMQWREAEKRWVPWRQ